MHAREYVVSGFALIMLIFFCWPLFALAGGIAVGIAPGTDWMKLAVGMTNNEITNTVHSLVLPLLGAVIVFRGNDIANLVGIILLVIMGFGILAGFLTFAFTNPEIMGNSSGFKPYLDEYGEVHGSILSMTSMLILLFLAKLGLEGTAANQPQDAADQPITRQGVSPVPAVASVTIPSPDVASPKGGVR